MKSKIAAVLTVLGLTLMVSATALADHGVLTEQGNCPIEGKVDVDSEQQAAVNGLVLDEGTQVCIKAGNNDGILITADGETTLQEYLFAAGIIAGQSGQGKDVSHYTVLHVPTTVPDDEETTTTTEAEETTTTTEAEEEETTTTTIVEEEETTTTTIQETTTTEAPVPLVPATELPFTGPPNLLLAGLGLGLLTAGGLLVRQGQKA